MSKGKNKKVIIKSPELVGQLIEALVDEGDILLTHLGRFRVISVKGRKVYNVKKRQMVPVPEFKQVSFTPSKGLRDILNNKARRD